MERQNKKENLKLFSLFLISNLADPRLGVAQPKTALPLSLNLQLHPPSASSSQSNSSPSLHQSAN
jgi:hypothetical protein